MSIITRVVSETVSTVTVEFIAEDTNQLLKTQEFSLNGADSLTVLISAELAALVSKI